MVIAYLKSILMASNDQRQVKISMFVYRKDGMSEEEFHHHWTTKHPLVVNDWLKKYGITRYVQVSIPRCLFVV